MTSDYEIALNTAIRSVLRRHQTDDATASAGLARAIAQSVAQGQRISPGAIRKAFRSANTRPFGRFRLREAQLADELASEFDKLIPNSGLKEHLQRFRDTAVRQFVRDLKPDDEAPARALLQAFLSANHGTFREVSTGRGQTDVIVGARDGAIIEVKLWKNQTYFDDGIAELREYLRTEGKSSGYYLVFDFSGDYLSEPRRDYSVSVEDVVIEVIWVTMPIVPASRIGSELRKRQRSRER